MLKLYWVCLHKQGVSAFLFFFFGRTGGFLPGGCCSSATQSWSRRPRSQTRWPCCASTAAGWPTSRPQATRPTWGSRTVLRHPSCFVRNQQQVSRNGQRSEPYHVDCQGSHGEKWTPISPQVYFCLRPAALPCVYHMSVKSGIQRIVCLLAFCPC